MACPMSSYPFPQVDLPLKAPSITETNSIDTTHLTPPITPHSEKDVPFKPTESDTTSLKMTKKHLFDTQHNRRHQQIRACASTSDAMNLKNTVFTMKPAAPPRSKSSPVWHVCRPNDAAEADLMKKDASLCHVHVNVNIRQPRRWTLPGKSGPTRGLTTLKPTVQYQTRSQKIQVEPSPALITLRRATVKSAQQTSLTFFPPPTFTRTKSSFMSYIMKQVACQNERTTENMDFLTNQVYHAQKGRAASIVVGMAHPTTSVVAGPALTEVMPSVPFVNINGLNQNRRCSTRYMSGSSAYEVIWDENDTPSSGSESPPPPSIGLCLGEQESGVANRRQSTVKDSLEMQLCKAKAPSRRGSEVEQESRSSRRESFQAVINSKFSRFFNSSALQNLPRSRGSYDSKGPTSVSIFNEPAMHQTLNGDSSSMTHTEQEFPPLQQDKNSNTVEDCIESAAHKDYGTTSNKIVYRPRMGSMLGASSHIRRRSILQQEEYRIWPGHVSAKRRKASGPASEDNVSLLERMPLLDTMGWEEQNPW